MYFAIVNDFKGNNFYEKQFEIKKSEKILESNESIVILNKKDKKIYEFKIKEIITKNPKYRIRLNLERVKALNFDDSDFEYLIKNYFKDDPLNSLIDRKIANYLFNNQMLIKDSLYFLKKIKEYSKNTGVNLYRGQKDATWEILPSIHRKRKKENLVEDHDKEKDLYLNIRKNNFSEFSEQEKFINEIIHMQHYGIPTPLVDWTLNPLIALFFSLDSSENDGRVFFTNRTRIINFSEVDYDRISNILEGIFKDDNSKIKKEDMDLILQDEDCFIETINENPRITAQKGLFSISFKPYRFNKNLRENLIDKLAENICSIVSKKEDKDKDKEKFVFSLKKMFEDILKECKEIHDVIEKTATDMVNYLVYTWKTSEEDQKDFHEKIKKLLKDKFQISFEQNSTERSIIILEEDKEGIKKELEHLLGINAVSVYPDVIGYIEYIKENF